MLKQYTHFVINGVLIALLAWVLQYGLFVALGNDSSFFYSLTTAIATIVTTIINFFIQRKFIFKNSGRFHRYIVADLNNLVIITLLAPLFRIITNCTS